MSTMCYQSNITKEPTYSLHATLYIYIYTHTYLPEQNYYYSGEKYHCPLVGSTKQAMCIEIGGNSALHSLLVSILSSSNSISTKKNDNMVYTCMYIL